MPPVQLQTQPMSGVTNNNLIPFNQANTAAALYQFFNSTNQQVNFMQTSAGLPGLNNHNSYADQLDPLTGTKPNQKQQPRQPTSKGPMTEPSNMKLFNSILMAAKRIEVNNEEDKQASMEPNRSSPDRLEEDDDDNEDEEIDDIEAYDDEEFEEDLDDLDEEEPAATNSKSMSKFKVPPKVHSSMIKSLGEPLMDMSKLAPNSMSTGSVKLEQNEKMIKKNKVIELYSKGERCVRKLSQLTGVPLTTVYRVIGKLKGINYNIPRGNGAGRKTILDAQDREILVEILNAQPRISRKALGKELEKRTGKSIHNSTLNRELCRLRHHGHNFAAVHAVAGNSSMSKSDSPAASMHLSGSPGLSQENHNYLKHFNNSRKTSATINSESFQCKPVGLNPNAGFGKQQSLGQTKTGGSVSTTTLAAKSGKTIKSGFIKSECNDKTPMEQTDNVNWLNLINFIFGIIFYGFIKRLECDWCGCRMHAAYFKWNETILQLVNSNQKWNATARKRGII